MNILSKDSPLEISISKMEQVLTDINSKITYSKQKHPINNCYSINLSSDDSPKYLYSNGKGNCSLSCKASALGEYIERLQTNNFFIEFYLDDNVFFPDQKIFTFEGKYLNEELKKLYNPNTELSLEDMIDYHSNENDQIITLPFINQSTNDTTYFPINILHNLYVSNGLATGNTPTEAQVQSLSEIYERYVKIKIIRNGYSLPSFPVEIVKSFPTLYADIQALQKLGYIIEVLDASLGGVFPVTAISIINTKTSGLFVSFGCHPILEVSLQRTMTELMQGRNLDELNDFEVPTFDMDLVNDNFNIESHFIDSNGKLGFSFLNKNKSFEYNPWKYNGKDTNDEHLFLSNIAKNMNTNIYLREYDYLGFYSCQIVIPSISEVYPVEDLIYNNTNVGKQIRSMVLDYENYDPNDILESIIDLDNSIDIAKYIGVIFEEDFTVLELKIQIYIDLGDYEDAISLLELSKNKYAKALLELCRMYVNEQDWEEYEDALNNIFTKELLAEVLDIFNGETRFINITYSKEYENIISLYKRLNIKKLNNSI